jgi:hypothetical protein
LSPKTRERAQAKSKKFKNFSTKTTKHSIEQHEKDQKCVKTKDFSWNVIVFVKYVTGLDRRL